MSHRLMGINGISNETAYFVRLEQEKLMGGRGK